MEIWVDEAATPAPPVLVIVESTIVALLPPTEIAVSVADVVVVRLAVNVPEGPTDTR